MQPTINASNHQHCWVDDQPQQSTVQHERPSSVSILVHWMIDSFIDVDIKCSWLNSWLYLPMWLPVYLQNHRNWERFIAMATMTQPSRDSGHGLAAVFRNGLVAPEVALGLGALSTHGNGSEAPAPITETQRIWRDFWRNERSSMIKWVYNFLKIVMILIANYDYSHSILANQMMVSVSY